MASGLSCFSVFVSWFNQPFIHKGSDEICLLSPEPRLGVQDATSRGMHSGQQPLPLLPKVAPLPLSKAPTPKSWHQRQAGPDTG